MNCTLVSFQTHLMGKVYTRKYLLGSTFRYHVKLPLVDWVAHRALLIQTNSLKKFNRGCFFLNSDNNLFIFAVVLYKQGVLCKINMDCFTINFLLSWYWSSIKSNKKKLTSNFKICVDSKFATEESLSWFRKMLPLKWSLLAKLGLRLTQN